MSSRKGRSKSKGAGPAKGEAADMAAKYVALLKGCRLCGAGAGYRMPIISKGSSPSALLLAAKIKDCLAIHVNSNDCMPPLICELCLDKVNDFYEFREMCRCTDQKIRSILGLPPQTVDQNSDDDCILGMSVPVFINSKEPSVTSQPKKSALKKEIKEVPKKTEKRTKKARSPSPPPLLMKSGRKRKVVEPSPPPSKKIRFSTPLLVERKSSRHSSPPPSKKRVTPSPSSKKAAPAQPAAPTITCTVCKMAFKTNKQLSVHQKTLHMVNYWPQKQSCSPCGKWFSTQKEADAHHRWHRSSNTYYTCQRCSTDFRVIVGYQKHLESKQCLPEKEVPDPLCTICNRHFVTENLLREHQCSGFGPPGENCPKCMENFATADQLRRHKLLCRVSMVELNPNNPHLQSLRCVSISMPRCDGLIPHIKQEPQDYIDIKIEPDYQGYEDFTTMDNIKDEPDFSGYENDLGGDDDRNSYASSTEDNNSIPSSNLVRNPFARNSSTSVDSLSVISLRTIFASPKLLGRKPKPKIKKEKDTSSDFDALISNNKAAEGVTPFDMLIQVNNPGESGAGDSETNCESEQINNVSVDSVTESPCKDSLELVCGDGNFLSTEENLPTNLNLLSTEEVLPNNVDLLPTEEALQSNLNLLSTEEVLPSNVNLLPTEEALSNNVNLLSTAETLLSNLNLSTEETLSNSVNLPSTEEALPSNLNLSTEEALSNSVNLPSTEEALPNNLNLLSTEEALPNNVNLLPTEAGLPNNLNTSTEEVLSSNVNLLSAEETLPINDKDANSAGELLQNDVGLSDKKTEAPIEPIECQKLDKMDVDEVGNISDSIPPVTSISQSPEQNMECDIFADKSFIPEINLSGIISRLGEPDNEKMQEESLLEDNENEPILEEIPAQKPVESTEETVPMAFEDEAMKNKTIFDSQTSENGTALHTSDLSNDVITNGDPVVQDQNNKLPKISEFPKADNSSQITDSVLSENELLGDVEIDRTDIIENEDDLLRDESEFPPV